MFQLIPAQNIAVAATTNMVLSLGFMATSIDDPHAGARIVYQYIEEEE